jgi:hypothetical protein
MKALLSLIISLLLNVAGILSVLMVIVHYIQDDFPRATFWVAMVLWINSYEKSA